MEAVTEIVKFLQIGARLDLKAAALEHLLGTYEVKFTCFVLIFVVVDLTGTEDGLKTIIEVPQLLVSFIALLDDTSIPIAKDASLCLINISANEKGAAALIHVDISKYCPPLQTSPENIVNQILKNIFDSESRIADHCCMILSNLTRPSHLIEKIVDMIEKTDKSFEELVNVFTKNQYNKNNVKLHYLGPVLSNLSQSHRVRMQILNKDKCVIQRLLPFTEYKDSLVRRGGIVGTLKNCCFETDFHEWLLSSEVDILPRLLSPLAGSEEFDEDDNDKLPLELQYLPEDKMREDDPDIR